MAKVEYVKLSDSEINFGTKNLLESQLGFATLLSQIKKYHALRRKELLLKIELRRRLEDAKETIRSLERILPKTEDEKPKYERTISSKKPSLEEEIEIIKKRLEELQ